MKKKYLILSLIITTAFTLCSCSMQSSSKSSPLSKTEFLMGTTVSVSLYDNKKEDILNKSFQKIKEIENEISINKNGTELDKINNLSGKEKVNAKNTTYDIIKKGLYYSEQSKGSFDITIGPLVKLWSIGLPEEKLPTKKEIDEKKALINYKDLEINDSSHSVYLKKPGMIIDLGGIAKGYTADEVIKILNENNVKSALVDLGGNLFALGRNPKNNNPWKIGIQDPKNSRGKIVGSISVENKSVVTSGIYERYFKKDGIRYHHILNPFTGYPYNNELAGISIVSAKSVDGDALSTFIFSKGLNEGKKIIEKYDGVDAIFITKDNKIYLTSGLKGNFTKTNENYKLISE
ncbi:FAD:protein FMN transferase [Hathewaya histolytica]|uniref:FAD:protein FMN transferase n=1 Tax=Hathewaya histolytica TaxID=1498 RepID=A0A4U9QZH0_HATHI|nr:FAD:protein FMN transferase [Hathewaya histolytica]VTQ81780.1 thiamine biosynthesis protein [Hathewaya histolytica]